MRKHLKRTHTHTQREHAHTQRESAQRERARDCARPIDKHTKIKSKREDNTHIHTQQMINNKRSTAHTITKALIGTMHKTHILFADKFVQFALLTNPIISVIIKTEKEKGRITQ